MFRIVVNNQIGQREFDSRKVASAFARGYARQHKCSVRVIDYTRWLDKQEAKSEQAWEAKASGEPEVVKTEADDFLVTTW